jgi:valyl-tRNA synthetase
MWNASRLVLLNVDEVAPGPRVERPEDAWILSRLERTVADVSQSLESYDFARVVALLYRFFWSELCDWYLEIAKPRLYDAEPAVSETLLWVLERFLALAHPVMPFVTEEIHSYMPSAEGHLATRPFPKPRTDLLDEAAEAELEALIELVRHLRRWRDLAGVPAGTVLRARTSNGASDLVGRLARLEFQDADSETAVATVGSIEVLSSEGLDPEQARARIEARREHLRAEVARAEGKLANDKFTSNAPSDVVEEERRKLGLYRDELEQLL